MNIFTRDPSFERFIATYLSWDENKVKCTRLKDLQEYKDAFNQMQKLRSLPSVGDDASARGSVCESDCESEHESSMNESSMNESSMNDRGFDRGSDHGCDHKSTKTIQDSEGSLRMSELFEDVMSNKMVYELKYPCDFKRVINFSLATFQIVERINILLWYYDTDHEKCEILSSKKMSIYQTWGVLNNSMQEQTNYDIYGAPLPRDIMLTFISNLRSLFY
jgi:hypothetical protein